MTLLRGKVGGFVAFLGIAALVLGGLGWVTGEALRLEDERRLADAGRERDRLVAAAVRERDLRQKELEERFQVELRQYDAARAAQIRLALWNLDGRVIPALAREDSRPYPHYVPLHSPFPAVTQIGAACEPGQVYLPSPLMTATLPDWMLLHFQIDPVNGWTSPQVVPESLQKMLRRQPIELALHNVDAVHKALLDELKLAYPARTFLTTLRKSGIVIDNNLAQQGLFEQSLTNIGNTYPQNFNPNGNPISNPNGSANTSQQQAGPYSDRGNNDNNKGMPELPDAAKRYQVTSRAKNEGLWAYLNDGRNYVSLEALFPSKKLDAKQNEVLTLEAQVRTAADAKKKQELEGKLSDLKKEVEELKRTILQPVDVELGSMQPLWLPGPKNPKHLILIRPAQVGNQPTYQGIVLDWEKLQQILKETLGDLMPQAKLIPVEAVVQSRLDRSMTALPVELDPGVETPPQPPEPVPQPELPEPVNREQLPSAGWTPLRIGLALAWAAALVALIAVGLGGWSLLDLSERRIRFVSAVTHELRTPLTTLRLYLDLLTSGMVSEEKQREEYIQTLSGEADRLYRLIGNVLDFARLEKTRPNVEKRPVPIADLLESLRGTWAERCAASGKDLQIANALPLETVVSTDRNLVEQILGNLIDNARKYSQDASDPRILIRTVREGSKLLIEIEDRGPGVAKRERCSIFRAFRRGHDADVKAGGVGLGLALATRWAGFIGGRLSVGAGADGVGACFRLELPG